MKRMEGPLNLLRELAIGGGVSLYPYWAEGGSAGKVTKSVGKGEGSLELVGVCVELSGETGETGQMRQALEGEMR